MLQDQNVERVIKNYTEPLQKQISMMQIELEALKKQCNIAAVSNSLPTTDELFALLEKLHKNCLYKLTPSDERCTHLPFELFDEVETMLSRRQ